MKKSASVFMILLTMGFVLVVVVTMSNNHDRIINLDQARPQDPSDALFININTATAEELMLLPKVSQGLANNIISYRNEHGPFESVVDIQQVKGIGDETYRQISPYLTVGGTS